MSFLFHTSGSVGALGEQSPGATRPVACSHPTPCSLSVASPHLTLFPRLNLIGFPGQKP